MRINVPRHTDTQNTPTQAHARTESCLCMRTHTRYVHTRALTHTIRAHPFGVFSVFAGEEGKTYNRTV